MAEVDTQNNSVIRPVEVNNKDPRGNSVRPGDVTGMDEKNLMQMIEKLYQQNLTLSKESKIVSEQLSTVLQKEKEKTQDKNKSTASASSGNKKGQANDNPLINELSEVYKQISFYQKGIKTMQNKYGASATYQRYKDLENAHTVKDKEINKLEDENISLDRTIAEKKKAMENLTTLSGNDTRLPALEKELRELRQKYKEINAKEKKTESENIRDNAKVGRMREELSKLKETYRYMLEKTGYDPVENIVRRKPQANPLYKRNATEGDARRIRSTSKKELDTNKELDDIQFNPQSFKQLFDQVKETKKVDQQKEAENRKALASLKAQIDAAKKESEENTKKLTDKEKESNILTIKLRELHRIAQFHSLLPKDEDGNVERASIKPTIKASALLSPVSGTKMGSPMSGALSRPKLSRLDSLNGFAKDTMLYKGYRKDERGRIFSENEGELFSDKDLMSALRPRIIGLKIWHDNRRITGFQAMYRGNDGKDVEGGQHAKNPQAYKLESFELSGEDYLKEISGFTGKTYETGIECLMLMSAKGETKKILEPSKEGRLFKLDINELEYPSIIYGYLKEEAPRNYVTKLGVLIASEDIEENLKGG